MISILVSFFLLLAILIRIYEVIAFVASIPSHLFHIATGGKHKEIEAQKNMYHAARIIVIVFFFLSVFLLGVFGLINYLKPELIP